MISHWTNHLWQSTLFAVVAALVTLAFRKNRAHVRYCLWLSASVKFLVPFALLMNLGNSLWRAFAARQIATRLGPAAISLTVQQIAQPFTDSLSFVPSTQLTHTRDWIPIAIFSVWICGFLGMVLVRFRGWLRIRETMRTSTPIDIQAAAAVRSSPGLLEPGVVGLLRPTLLLPEEILKHMPQSQLQAVIAHELSHVRRRDNLTAAIHMVVEAVFWFHPFVWWIGTRLVEERERACDEAVLSLGGEPRDYADAIVSVCRFYVESPLACVSGISGADLKKRIVRIMARHVGLRMSLGRKLLLGTAGLLAVAVPVVVGWGQAQSAKVQLVHPENGVKYTFEVATIKPNLDSAPGLRIELEPAHTAATHVSAYDLIKFAYGIKSDDQLLGAPSWLKTECFDIQAKASEADIARYDKLGFEEQIKVSKLLLQSLLEDRFQLKARVEPRDLPVYALVVANGGIKMKEVQMDPIPHAGVPPAPGAHLPRIARTGKNEVTASAFPMNGMAEWLSRSYEVGHRPVVDETGLKGNYDFVLGVSLNPPPPDDGSSHDPPVSLFTALPEQLGLKLIPEKALTEVLVIEHVEQPSPN